ncbi:MAG: hypothetical protein K9N29_07835 [Candidatus Marinimicrobia bacterium]|nr:hypothetical protein [Candidatus Neomarinimicrobiota bacterium]
MKTGYCQPQQPLPPFYFREEVAGDRLLCTVIRNGVLQDIHLTVGFKPTTVSELIQIKEPSESQKLVVKKWLGLPWDQETRDRK